MNIPPPGFPEHYLARGLLEGDRAVLAYLYGPFRERLMPVLKRLEKRCTWEDGFQKGLLGTIEKLQKSPADQIRLPYLIRACKRAMYTKPDQNYHSKHAQTLDNPDYNILPAADLALTLEEQEYLHFVADQARRLFATKKDSVRETCRLYFLEGLGPKVIAERTNQSPATVEKTIYRVRQELHRRAEQLTDGGR